MSQMYPETKPTVASPKLQLNFRLQNLRTIDFQIDEDCKEEDLFQASQQDTLLPGAILVRQGKLTGLISRTKFLEILSRAFGRELFLRRPLNALYSIHPFIHEALTILSGDIPIFEAVRICLQRPSEFLYEPIVVKISPQTYRVLAFQDLVVAQTQIYQVALLTIEERTAGLAQANAEINKLNEKLQGENLRMELWQRCMSLIRLSRCVRRSLTFL